MIGLKLIKIINFCSFLIFRFLYHISIILYKDFNIQKKVLFERINSNKNEIYKYPEYLVVTTISIEDRRFKYHYGHDLISILRATIRNFKNRRIEGASTIEQQLIRTILNKREISFKRKLYEIMFSTEIYKTLSKEQIINLYFNNYEFQFNNIGIKNFCKKNNYKLDKLSNSDVHEIVAHFKYPTINKKNYNRYLKRVRLIEKKMNQTLNFTPPNQS